MNSHGAYSESGSSLRSLSEAKASINAPRTLSTIHAASAHCAYFYPKVLQIQIQVSQIDGNITDLEHNPRIEVIEEFWDSVIE